MRALTRRVAAASPCQGRGYWARPSGGLPGTYSVSSCRSELASLRSWVFKASVNQL